MVDKLVVKKSFNGKLIKEFKDLYAATAQLNESDTSYHIVHSDVNFHQPASIAYLNTPIFNGKNVKLWMESLVKVTDNNLYIKGPKAFKGTIFAQNGVHIDTLNDIDIKSLIKNIVTTNGDITIYGNLIFEDDLGVEIVALRGNLTTDNMNGVYLHEWLLNAIPIDKDVNYNGEKFLLPNKLTKKPLFFR